MRTPEQVSNNLLRDDTLEALIDATLDYYGAVKLSNRHLQEWYKTKPIIDKYLEVGFLIRPRSDNTFELYLP